MRADVSDLELEFELAMDNTTYMPGEAGDHRLGDDEFEFGEDEYEYEAATTFDSSDYADRFFELSQWGVQSEFEVAGGVEQILSEMETEYFWGSLKRLANAGQDFLGRKAGQLAKAGLGYATKQVPVLAAIEGATQLARGNLKGALGQVAKTALGSMIPGGAALPNLLAALGLGGGGSIDGWRRFVELARRSFEVMAENASDEVDHPAEASRLSHDALQTALAAIGAPRPTGGLGWPGGGSEPSPPRRKVILVRPGIEYVLRVRQ